MANRQKKSAKAALISAEDKARIDMLHIQVNSLVPAEQGDVMKQQLRTLHESFLAACTSENVLSYAIESLMDNCLESRPLCEKVAITFQVLSDVVVGQTKVRSVILTCLQNNFSSLKELQESNNKQWLNSIALFVAIFHHVRYANGTHLMMLASFVIQALQPLLSGDEEEMTLLAKSVISNGHILQEGAPNELDELLVETRSTLIKRNLSSECRSWLLLTVDVAEVKFSPLRTPILNFYKENLGESIVAILDAGEKNIPVSIPEKAASAENANAKSQSPPSKSPKSPVSDSAPRESPSRKSPEKSDRRSHEPRSRDDLVNKVQSFQISEKSQKFAGAINYSPKSSKGHWEHDDRFSNDYEAPRPRPDRGRGKKIADSSEPIANPEFGNRSDRPERTKIPDGNWRQSPNKEAKERVVPPASKIVLPPCEESWD